MKGRRDEHNGGAGRDSGEPIAMALLGDTSLREMDGHKGGIRHGVELKKEGGGKQREGLFKRRERFGWWEGGSGANPELGYLFVCSERASCHWVQVDYGMPCHQIVISL